MNELQFFNNNEFGQIRTVFMNGEPWMVGKDVAAALGYGDGKSLANAVARHVDDEDKGVTELVTPGGKQQMVIINESGLYSLVLSSKLPGARKFRRWVTSEVLPSIRRTGGYNLPKDFPSALRALADTEEQRLALLAENEKQRKAIADFEPIKNYVDTILSCEGAMAVSQIAADYDMSAKRLNRILHEAGLQYRVNGQWILYQQHAGKGYTDSETITINHRDGTVTTRLFTRWTQKGRLLIHDILTRQGIQAVMDKEGENHGQEA